MRQTGLDDFGAGYYQEGLEQLIGSVNADVRFHPIGHLTLHRVIVTNLKARLVYVTAKRRTLERFQTPLKPPLIVVGLPRSGTTFLHRLLAADPRHRAVPFWEASYPLAQHVTDNPARRLQRARQELRLRRWLAPELDRKHLIRAELPEECMFGLGMTFTSLLYWVLAPLYGYLEWYQRTNRDQKYREYRDLLGVWQATDPARPLVLKAPSHTGSLIDLIKHVPEAHIVQTHRDPVAVVGSFQSLNHTTHQMVTHTIDGQREAKANLNFLKDEAERSVRAAKMHPAKLYHLPYSQLVKDPLEAVKAIYQHFRLPLSDAFKTRLSAYIAEHPQHKHGKHVYRVSDYGLSEGLIRDTFQDYSAYFGIDG